MRFAISILAFATLPAVAAPAEKPEAFVRRVYALYRANGPAVSMIRPKGTAFYAPALLDAFAKDTQAANGEIGAIDTDPICACQDYDLRLQGVTVAPGGGGAVKARASIKNFESLAIITLTLVPTARGWRIADVGSKDMPSVMAVLQDAAAHPVPPEPPGAVSRTPPKR